MDPPVSSSEVADRANELYWGSDLSVNQIAEQLDLSKGAFYGVIRGLPSGSACPACRAEVVHPNRTARDRGLHDCLHCGWTGPEAVPISPVALSGGESSGPRQGHAGADSRAFWGRALLGGAAALALLLWVRRR